MPTMLMEIVGQIDAGLSERFGALLRADAAVTERAIDASVPAILAGLARRASNEPAVVLDVVTTYVDLAPGSESDDGVGGAAIADVAFGDSVQTVVDGIARHVEASPADVASLVGEVSGVVGSYLAARVASGGLDANELAALLAAERTSFEAVGLDPLLARWGLAVAASPDAGGPEEATGFKFDPDAGAPAGLWWLTGLITIALFAIAISQCG